MTKAGPVFNFTTAGMSNPPPDATTVVMWTANVPAANLHGRWAAISDSTAAGGSALQNADAANAKIAPALASPANYFEQTFNAVSGADYHLWIRMRAQNNSLSNDSVHVQFSDSVDSVGNTIMRIGSTDSPKSSCRRARAARRITAGDGATTAGAVPAFRFASPPAARTRFASSSGRTVRSSIRFVLSPDKYISTPPGPRQDDATILQNTDNSSPPPPPPPTTVLWFGETPSSAIQGNWQPLSDATAAGGTALWNPNAGAAKFAPALASPTNYVETTFTADAGRAYHIWVRMRAQDNSLSNDSVHIQFSDSVDASGNAFAQIGTASSTEYVLQNGPNGAPDQNWGWTDNGWGALGPTCSSRRPARTRCACNSGKTARSSIRSSSVPARI